MATVKRNQKTLSDIRGKMSLGIKKTAFYLETKMRRKGEKEKAIDTGTYLRGFYSKMKGKYRAEVGNSKNYAYFVEYGRKAGKYPNFDAIVGWTARHFNLPGKTLTYDKAGKKLKSAVFLVARSIKKKGTKGKEVMQKTYDEEKNNLVEVFRSVFK